MKTYVWSLKSKLKKRWTWQHMLIVSVQEIISRARSIFGSPWPASLPYLVKCLEIAGGDRWILGSYWLVGQSSVLSEFQASKQTCLKERRKERKGSSWGMIVKVVICPQHVYTHTNIHPCLYILTHASAMCNLHIHIDKHKSNEYQIIIGTCVPTCLALAFWSLRGASWSLCP